MSTNCELYLKGLGQVIALSGLLFGLWQYTKAQRWKKAEFAAKELEKLNTDPILSLACTLLDWNLRKLSVPEAYNHKAEKESFFHNWKILSKAMAPDIIPDDGRKGFTWQEVMYRDVLDHLFTYFEMLNHYVEINLINCKDISIIKYWLQQIAGSELADNKSIFQRFIQKFGYDGVNRLSWKLGVDPKEKI